MIYPPEQLFIWRYEELGEIESSCSPPAALRAAAIARHLFLDSPALFHQANQNIRTKPIFRMLRVDDDPLIGPGSLMLSSPGAWKPGNFNIDHALTLNLDQFLSHRIEFIMGKWYSVKDTILYLANSAGGVHSGAPKPAQEGLSGHEILITTMTSLAGTIRGGVAGLYSKLKA